MLDQCFKLLKAINSGASPWQISLGSNLGLALGLLPLYTPSALVLIFLVCVLRINLASFLLAFSFFSGLAWMLDQTILSIGESILHAASWQDVFISFYQKDVFLFFQFNHTQVMGAWALIVLFLPFGFLFTQYIIIKYRSVFLRWLKASKVMQWLAMNKWYQRLARASEIASELK